MHEMPSFLFHHTMGSRTLGYYRGVALQRTVGSESPAGAAYQLTV